VLKIQADLPVYYFAPFAGIILSRLSGMISASIKKHPGNSVVLKEQIANLGSNNDLDLFFLNL
jgi:hypothetical protein